MGDAWTHLHAAAQNARRQVVVDDHRAGDDVVGGPQAVQSVVEVRVRRSPTHEAERARRQQASQKAGETREQGEVERQTAVPDASNEPRPAPHAQVYLTDDSGFCLLTFILHMLTRLTALFRDYPGEPVPER